jgi:DNA mismatch repair ATPase MutL
MNTLIRTLTLTTIATVLMACGEAELETTTSASEQASVIAEDTSAITPEETSVETEPEQEETYSEPEEETETEVIEEEVAKEETPEAEEEEEAEEETRSITLSWTPPSTRANGDALELSEISGYEVYYFMDGSPDGDGETNAINSPNITELAIDDLSPGIYYFSIAAIDTDGLASEMSEAVEADLQ